MFHFSGVVGLVLATLIPIVSAQESGVFTTLSRIGPTIPPNGVTIITLPETITETTLRVVTTTNNEIISEFLVTRTTSGTRYIEMETTTIGSTTPSIDVTSSSPTTTASSSTNHGVIAGSVVGAIILLLIAGIIFLHFRNKRSPIHWRNRPIPLGQWHTDKVTPPPPVFSGIPHEYEDRRPFNGSRNINLHQGGVDADEPVASIFVRENDRPTSYPQFKDNKQTLGGPNSGV